MVSALGTITAKGSPAITAGRPSQNRNAQRIAAQVRRHEFLQLKVAGLTNIEIGARYNVDPSKVSRELTRIMGELAHLNQPAADQERQVQDLRLEKTIRAIWPRVVRGELDAIDRLIKLLDRKAAIWGMVPDKPVVAVDMRQQTINFGVSPGGDSSYDDDNRISQVLEILAEAGVLPEGITDSSGVGGDADAEDDSIYSPYPDS